MLKATGARGVIRLIASMYDGAKDAYSYEWSRQNPFFRGALCTITLSYKGIKNNASPVYRRDAVHGTCDEYSRELIAISGGSANSDPVS